MHELTIAQPGAGIASKLTQLEIQQSKCLIKRTAAARWALDREPDPPCLADRRLQLCRLGEALFQHPCGPPAVGHCLGPGQHCRALERWVRQQFFQVSGAADQGHLWLGVAG